MVESRVIDWIKDELRIRGWSQRELARQAGIAQSQVSNILSGNQPYNADFLIKVAEALGEPAETALRLADLLPGNVPDDDAITQEIVELVRTLPDAQKTEVLRFVRFVRSDSSRSRS